MDALRRKSISLLIVLSLLIGIVGIANADTTYAASKKIHLNKTKVTLVAGKTYQQKLIDKNGKTIKASKVKWKSSKKSIAKISKKGKITALKAGTAKMTAKYKGKVYKFTVKIKKPFSSSQKPTLIEAEYFEPDLITLEWTKLRNAQKYQIYVSVNGGEFKLYETIEDTSSFFEGAKEGSTYTFKVRGVCGKYNSAFSPAKSIKIPKSGSNPKPSNSTGNTSISIDSSYEAIMKGYSKTVEVKTDKGEEIEYEVDNNNVSCVWGDWNGNTCELKIIGEKLGSSVITVRDTNDASVKATIEVYIYSPLELLQFYISEEGYTNGNGEQTISYNQDGNDEVFFVDHGNSVEFISVMYYDTSEFESITLVKMKLEVPEDYSTKPEITIEIGNYNITAHANLTTSTYKDTDSLYFYKDAGNISATDVQELCNTSFRVAMSYWDEALMDLLYFNMNDMGFTSY